MEWRGETTELRFFDGNIPFLLHTVADGMRLDNFGVAGFGDARMIDARGRDGVGCCSTGGGAANWSLYVWMTS